MKVVYFFPRKWIRVTKIHTRWYLNDDSMIQNPPCNVHSGVLPLSLSLSPLSLLSGCACVEHAYRCIYSKSVCVSVCVSVWAFSFFFLRMAEHVAGMSSPLHQVLQQGLAFFASPSWEMCCERGIHEQSLLSAIRVRSNHWNTKHNTRSEKQKNNNYDSSFSKTNPNKQKKITWMMLRWVLLKLF